MRVWLMAAAVLLAGPVWAQPVKDGRASVDADLGSFVENYPANMHMPDKGVSAFRSIISFVVTRGMKPEDQDLFLELTSGQPVVVTAPGKTINVPAVTGDALAIVKLFAAPPNLNTLYTTPGEPILQLVEMSRWGAPAKARITGFLANKLYAGWAKSQVRTAYREWVSEFAGINNAMDSIADKTVQTQAKLLLKSAMEQVFAKCKADGRELPPLYLYEGAFLRVGVPVAQ